LRSCDQLLEDVAPPIEQIDGRLFLDRFGAGLEPLKVEIAKYADAREAQQWINLVAIDDFLDMATTDWSMDDEALKHAGADAPGEGAG
jgi:hypothetical protein